MDAIEASRPDSYCEKKEKVAMIRPSMTDEQIGSLMNGPLTPLIGRWVNIEAVLCSTVGCKHPPVDAFEEKYRWVFDHENCKTDLDRFILGEKLDEDVLRRLEYFLTVAVPKIRKD